MGEFKSFFLGESCIADLRQPHIILPCNTHCFNLRFILQKKTFNSTSGIILLNVLTFVTFWQGFNLIIFLTKFSTKKHSKKLTPNNFRKFTLGSGQIQMTGTVDGKCLRLWWQMNAVKKFDFSYPDPRDFMNYIRLYRMTWI